MPGKPRGSSAELLGPVDVKVKVDMEDLSGQSGVRYSSLHQASDSF